MRIFNAIVMVWSIALATAIILFCMMFPSCARADIKDSDAIRAIIGEASGEGLEGMRAVASAIRNRGHLKGVYGLNAPHVDREPAWVWKLARQAWEDSLHDDFSNGATGFGNKSDLAYWQHKKWWNKCQIVKVVGNTIFYKEIK